MHFAEALLARDEAVAMAASAVRSFCDRQAAYLARAPHLAPDPDRPQHVAIRAQDAWYFIPFDRAGGVGRPFVVRVNGLTRTVVLDDRA